MYLTVFNRFIIAIVLMQFFLNVYIVKHYSQQEYESPHELVIEQEYPPCYEPRNPYLWPATENFPYSSVTFSTQCSSNKLTRLMLLTKRWKGPISIAVYVHEEQDIKDWWEFYCEDGNFRRVSISFVFPDDPRFEHLPKYPVNMLRNIGWGLARTEFVALVDVDHLPDPNSYKALSILAQEHLSEEHSRNLLIIPTFEVMEGSREYMNQTTLLSVIPNTKEEIISGMNSKTYQYFHSSFYNAYGRTNYNKWIKTSTPYEVKYGIDFEPYVVVRTNLEVKFYECFCGFAMNYNTWSAELNLNTFKWLVAPNAFLFHWAHERHGVISDQIHDAKAGWIHKMNSKYPVKSKHFARLYKTTPKTLDKMCKLK
eukprot:TRINITY_DN3091_c0_g1_i1.p1 TRINITY_DN3091_c0_g1~~TRINITY_DN3091_c0_g1_i1.p1  ORF type:complete len:368 (-),score=48.97 TRINITY_DN3091_c0_g1_i1:110-1213(-)